MEPINQAERKTAITKFFIFLVLSVCLFVLPFFFYGLIPSNNTPAPKPEIVEPKTDPSQIAEVKQRLSTLANRMKNINIMFLVDATEGMGQHLPAVAQSAQNVRQQYDAEVAAACYRDAAEGAWLYMTNTMVGDDPAPWIRSLDTKTKFDRDEPEALYYGLKNALESEHLTVGETNLLILVGDAGNHAQEPLTDVSPTEIVELLKGKDCHFGAFQVQNPTSSTSYAEFSTQMMNDILEPVKASFESGTFQEKDSLDRFGLYYQLKGETQNLLYAVNPSQSLTEDALTDKINQFVDEVLAPLQQYTGQIEELAAGNYSGSLEPELLNFLNQYQITEEELELLRQ
jgi:hypothetical protein